MPRVMFPFPPREVERHNGDLLGCPFVQSLPAPLQEAGRVYPHLLEYLHLVPIQELGAPGYYEKLSRKLRDLKMKNLLYPVGDGVFVHICPTQPDGRDTYIPIEPHLNADLSDLMDQIEARLLDYTDILSQGATAEERKASLYTVVDTICFGAKAEGRRRPFNGLFKSKQTSNTVVVPKEQVGPLKYLLARDKLGMGILQPFIQDTNIEDLSCSGVGALFVEHKVFGSLKSAVSFPSHEELDEFVVRLAEQIKKPVTFRNPIVDATLPDGSRINIVYGRDISKRGSNFTIRKVSETPLSILELIEFGSMTYEMAAYLSLVIGEGMNVFVAGETASGKTTLLNALTVFIAPRAKVVSIEDTPELQIPHPNWIREVVRGTKAGEVASGVSMFELLKAALRQRPNEIIIGEIRGEEGNIAFQAMQTGHAAMATFHAASVEKLIQRLTGHPISVPKTYVDNLNSVVIQSAVKLPGGKIGRRALSISEIVGYDPSSDSFSYIEVFRWKPEDDTFEFIGNMNSYLLEEKIAFRRGFPPNAKRKIYDEVARRARVLERLHKAGVVGFHELYQVLAKAQSERLF